MLTNGWLATAQVARLLAAPFSTVARALNRLGLVRLRNLEPKPSVQRYERKWPVDLIHIDVKKLARFRPKWDTASQASGRAALLASVTTGSTWPSRHHTARLCRDASR